jgi:hypothetical protein
MVIQVIVVELNLDEGRFNGCADGRMMRAAFAREAIQCGWEDEQA